MLDSGFQSPGFRIPGAKNSWIPESGFPYMGRYQVGPQTIAATSEIDPKFSNQEIEWFTKERGCIILYGLLVKLDEAD